LPEETAELKQTLDRFWQIARRRRWWILSGFGVVTLSAILIAYLLPAEYRSEATILVEQQQVPERYVTPTTTADLLQALQAMTQDILSRTRLLQIMSEFDLYAAEKKRLGPEELVQLMRKRIEIEPLVPNSDRRAGVNAFKISFQGHNPATTQGVVNRLTALFIDQNLKTREQQATGTTNFLQDQLSTAQAKLQEQEKRLRDFKMQHLGELPEEQQGNLQILAGLQMQLQNTMAALGRAREQEVYLESLLAQYRSLSPKAGADVGQMGMTRVETIEKQLTDLRTQRAALVAHYTPQHPDVVNIDRQIAQTQALLDLVKKKQKNDKGDATDLAAVQVTDADDPAVAQLKSQLKANQLEIANASAEEKLLQARIGEYQRRLNTTPVREQELAEILRDYTLSQQNYADLENKKTQSALATRLEENQQGQRFKIVDPANLPLKPFSPDRPKIGMIGAVLGILLGAGLAIALEVKDTSFHSEGEVKQLLSLPLVIGVPVLRGPMEATRRSRRVILEWIGGSILVTGVLAVELFVFWKG